MIKTLFLQYAGYYGGAVGNLLAKWEQIGVFSYVIPFLIIFALVFGILHQMNMFKGSKGVNSIIALMVALMSLQFDFVPVFFSEIFPRMGVGLAIILVLLILTGLFIDPEKKFIMYTLLVIGVVIVIVVLVNTGESVGWSTGYWWRQNWDMILGIVVFLVIVGLIIGSTKPPTTSDYKSYMFREKPS